MRDTPTSRHPECDKALGIRVVVVGRPGPFRQSLALAFDRSSDFVVAGEAGTGTEALSLIGDGGPCSVVITDDLPEREALSLIKSLRTSEDPTLRIVVYDPAGADWRTEAAATYSDSHYLLKLLEAGVDVVLTRRQTYDDILCAARPTTAGWGEPPAKTSPPPLSHFELSLLDLLSRGEPGAHVIHRVAEALNVSETIAKEAILDLYGKLGASNRLQVMMAAFNMGLLPPDEESPRWPG